MSNVITWKCDACGKIANEQLRPDLADTQPPQGWGHLVMATEAMQVNERFDMCDRCVSRILKEANP